jgi:hypothetical protein
MAVFSQAIQQFVSNIDNEDFALTFIIGIHLRVTGL